MKPRPMPADFYLHAKTESNKDLRLRYNAGAGALARWLRDCDIASDRREELRVEVIPAGFAEAAAVKYNRDLMVDYGVSYRTVKSWKSRLGIASPPRLKSTPPIQAPAEFANLARTMTRNQLKVHFRRCLNTIDRWAKETGVKAKPATRGALERSAKVFAGVAAPTYRDHSTVGQAADYLRRYGPVVRCDTRGTYDPNGMNWRRGSTLLGPEDVIERAQHLGWSA